MIPNKIAKIQKGKMGMPTNEKWTVKLCSTNAHSSLLAQDGGVTMKGRHEFVAIVALNIRYWIKSLKIQHHIVQMIRRSDCGVHNCRERAANGQERRRSSL